jgi:hypothetical protein
MEGRKEEKTPKVEIVSFVAKRLELEDLKWKNSYTESQVLHALSHMRKLKIVNLEVEQRLQGVEKGL